MTNGRSNFATQAGQPFREHLLRRIGTACHTDGRVAGAQYCTVMAQCSHESVTLMTAGNVPASGVRSFTVGLWDKAVPRSGLALGRSAVTTRTISSGEIAGGIIISSGEVLEILEGGAVNFTGVTDGRRLVSDPGGVANLTDVFCRRKVRKCTFFPK